MDTIDLICEMLRSIDDEALIAKIYSIVYAIVNK